MLVLYPILIAALVGFAVTSGPSKPRVAILNEVPPSANTIDLGGQRVNVSKESKPLFESIKTVKVHSRAEAIRKVRDGDVLAALVIPPDITRNLEAATSGGTTTPHLEVLYNAEDPAKQTFVEDTIKARVQDANAALAKKFTQVAASYIRLLSTGGSFAFAGNSFDILGLARTETVLRATAARLPKGSAQLRGVEQGGDFAPPPRPNPGPA